MTPPVIKPGDTATVHIDAKGQLWAGIGGTLYALKSINEFDAIVAAMRAAAVQKEQGK